MLVMYLKIWWLDFNFLQHSASSLSPGPEVHLGQDASLPMTTDHLTPLQESDIALEKTPSIWSCWVLMSQMEEHLFPSSDWTQCCLNIAILLLVMESGVSPIICSPQCLGLLPFAPGLLCSMPLAIRLPSRTVKSPLKPQKEHPRWLRKCGALGSPESGLKLSRSAKTAKSHCSE